MAYYDYQSTVPDPLIIEKDAAPPFLITTYRWPEPGEKSTWPGAVDMVDYAARETHIPAVTIAGPNTGQGGIVLPSVYDYTNWLDDFYERIHILPATSELGNITGDVVIPSLLWNAYLDISATLDAITGENVEGISVDTSAPQTLAPQAFIEFNVLVSAAGPPTIAATISFDMGAIGLIPMYVFGTRLVTLNFVPGQGMTETIEWKTDVKTSHNGEEERYQVRDAPRTSLAIEQSVEHRRGAELRNDMRMNQSRIWGVPQAHEVTVIRPFFLPIGSTEILFDTSSAQYTDDGYIYIWFPDNTRFSSQLVDVQSDRVILSQPTEVSFDYPEAVVMPLRFGYVDGDLRLGAYDGRSDSMLIQTAFDLNDDTDPFYGDASPVPWPLYKLTPIFDHALNFSTGAEESAKIRMWEVDNDAAIFDRGSDWDSSRLARSIKVEVLDKAAMWDIRRFFYEMAGQLAEFWLPIHTSDFRLINDVLEGQTALTITYQGFEKVSSDKWPHLMIVADDSSISYHEITEVTKSISNENVITITPGLPLGKYATAATATISRLQLSRLGSDKVTMSHFTNKTDITFTTLEVR